MKRGECPGCCYECEKAEGCEWVCGPVSKANHARILAETQEETRKQENEAFEASPLGKLRRRLRETLAAYGVHGESDLSHIVYCSWIWTDNPSAYSSTLSLSGLLDIAGQVGIDLQELLFGNPEGAPLRQLDEQMQQAVQEPQYAPIWHPYPAEKPNEWVNRNERLPEWKVDVLVLYDSGKIDINWADSVGEFMYENIYGRVTHWMPLPAPPDRRPPEGEDAK